MKLPLDRDLSLGLIWNTKNHRNSSSFLPRFTFSAFFFPAEGDEDCSVAPLDGAALLGLADLTKVDLILESGTAGGRSAELMARFFNQSVQIVTVDWGDIGDGGRCGEEGGRCTQTFEELCQCESTNWGQLQDSGCWLRLHRFLVHISTKIGRIKFQIRVYRYRIWGRVPIFVSR